MECGSASFMGIWEKWSHRKMVRKKIVDIFVNMEEL